MKLSSFLTILQWLPHYNKEQFKGDLIAGLTVGIMLIPQGMAYAIIAGVPPIYGLYASTAPLIIYALFGTSRQLSVAPVAIVSLLVAAGVSQVADTGTDTYLATVIMLALFVGVLQFGLGLCRLGFLVNFLSHPVVSGFISASAIIIALSQLNHLFGISLPQSFYVHELLYNTTIHLHEIHWLTLAVGLGGILLLLISKKLPKIIPGSLLVVVVGILAVWSLGLSAQGVKIIGTIPSKLPSVHLPTFDLITLQALLPTIFAITLVSLIESISVAKSVQARHKTYKVIPNKELIALGLANMGSAFVQGFPVDGSFSRTAVNDRSGAKTGIASIISALLVILTLLFLTPLFYYLPMAALAAIIIVAVLGLVDIKEARRLWFTNRTDFWMLIVTFLATATLGIQQGIGIGVILSLVMLVFRTTRPHIAVLGQVPETNLYRNVSRFEQVKQRPELLIIRFDAQLYFANVTYFREKMDEMVTRKGEALKAIIISAESISSIDSSAVQILEDMVTEFRSQGLELYFADVKGPVRDALVRSHLLEKIGAQNFFMSVQLAVEHFDLQEEKVERPLQEFTLQSNVKKRR